ncbi:MAG TPA: 16S rRNA (adenine(1518)-N(6)/adenine(1519)-N(6))-dimethyltransferase RsmA [Tenuifilaceae bacterium]|nr:16S rRNA (adenine(1518)-N(6)/adenine(1519)-N(6))-dimethyltransferase RsmA [Tenuifilaceae bacterium]
MTEVRPKKQLGQHFLADNRIAQRIVDSVNQEEFSSIVEVGPGMGVLTKGLLTKYADKFFAVEVDEESVAYLHKNYPGFGQNLIYGDFLNIPIDDKFGNSIVVIGNLPYNISSQIFFKILDLRQRVHQVVAMVQREVAQRIAEKPGSKTYGILSVLLQAYYNIEYLFTVNEGSFIPPPKVKSAVIRLTRNSVNELGCNPALFVRVVKASFNQRRKTLRNSIRSGFNGLEIDEPFASKRAEQLSVADFVTLTNSIEAKIASL